jgi:hypothetical protein
MRTGAARTHRAVADKRALRQQREEAPRGGDILLQSRDLHASRTSPPCGSHSSAHGRTWLFSSKKSTMKPTKEQPKISVSIWALRAAPVDPGRTQQQSRRMLRFRRWRRQAAAGGGGGERAYM